MHAARIVARIAAASHASGKRYGLTRSLEFMATLLRALRIHPRSDHASFIFAETLAPCGHDAVAAATHTRGDTCEIAAIKPNTVRQVRRAHRGVAAPVDAMASSAQCFEARFARRLPIFWRGIAAECQHVGRDFVDALATEHVAPRRHRTPTTFHNAR